MNDQCNVVNIPIEPLLHEWFMVAAKQFGFNITISGGEYLVEYENAIDLYNLGLTMRYQPREVLSDRCRLPVAQSQSQPKRRKNK